MKICILFVTLVVGSVFVVNFAVAAEQKIIFNVETISYKKDTGSEKCQEICSEKYSDPTVESLITNGWRIISSSPKEAPGRNFLPLPVNL